MLDTRGVAVGILWFAAVLCWRCEDWRTCGTVGFLVWRWGGGAELYVVLRGFRLRLPIEMSVLRRCCSVVVVVSLRMYPSRFELHVATAMIFGDRLLSVAMASVFVKITGPYLAVSACMKSKSLWSWWLLSAWSVMGLLGFCIVLRPAWVQRVCSDVADVVVMAWVSFFIPGKGLVSGVWCA